MTRPWSARSEAERKRAEAAFVARHGGELLLDGDPEPATAIGAEALSAPPRGRRPLPFARLHAALRSGGPLPREVSAALREDSDLREDFTLLVQRNARQHLPRAAAAAGREGLHRREAGGFIVRLVASRAVRDQVYLLVELPEPVVESTVGAEMEAGPVGIDPWRGPDEDRGGPSPAAATPSAPEGEHAPGPTGGTQGKTAAGAARPPPNRIVVRTGEGEFLKQPLAPPEDRTIRLVMPADDPLVRAVGEPASEIYLL